MPTGVQCPGAQSRVAESGEGVWGISGYPPAKEVWRYTDEIELGGGDPAKATSQGKEKGPERI